ncbi:UNVERIFIED_CONTAM: hypothetical protein KB574_10760, partial [Streptococcus canis]
CSLPKCKDYDKERLRNCFRLMETRDMTTKYSVNPEQNLREKGSSRGVAIGQLAKFEYRLWIK